MAAAPRGRGRPPLTAEDIAARRSRIVEAAARAFFTNGYADTSIDAIARDAGVTKRGIYELVGDKRALFSAACSQLRAEGPHFGFNVAVEGLSARAVLLDMARQLLIHSLDPVLITLERAVVAEAAQNTDITTSVVSEGKTILNGVMARIFERLIAAGELPPHDPHYAGDLFYDVVVGARGFRAVFGCVERIDETDIAIRVDMFLAGFACIVA